MSVEIDDSDKFGAVTNQTSNDDIFSNPLEAFPEFIDEPVSAPVQTAVAEPEPEKAAEIPVEAPAPEPEAPAEQVSAPEPAAPEPPKAKPKYIPSYSSANYVDPLDTIEEINPEDLSSEVQSFSFDDEDAAPSSDDDAGAIFTKTNFTLGSIEYEDVAVKPGAELYDIDDSVPDAAPETEEVSIDDFLSDAGTGTEEVDLDAFLGDSSFDAGPSPAPSAGANATEEVSLDDFGVDFGGVDMAAIDAFAASSKQEKSDIENAPAIEMELEFDDEFVLETKANPEDDIDFDFEALMAGESVDVPVPTATGDETLDNFDDIFDNIVDEGAPSAPAASSDSIEFDPSAIEEVSLDDFGLGRGDSSSPSAAPAGEAVAEQQITFDEVSEFDDLLSSFSDDTHVEVADNRSAREASTGPHDYNIIVVMDDEDEAVVEQAPAPAETSEEDEDYEISIFKTEAEAESYRKHDAAPAAQESFSVPEAGMSAGSSFTPGSDSFEDISLDDFGVSFEDETPSEKTEEKPAEASTEAPAETPAEAASEMPEATEEKTAQEAAAEEPETDDLFEAATSSAPSSETASEEIAPEDFGIDEDLFDEIDSETSASEEAPAPEISETLDEPEMPEEPEFMIEDAPSTEGIPETEPETFAENSFDMDETPVSADIPDELDIDEPENGLSFTECEDTTVDDKKIVELSEDCVYNGDNTEYTSNVIDGNNEENTDTMDSMNEGLLEKIVSELSVLRNEMQTLRDEVQTLKGGEPAGFEADAAPAFQEEESVIPEEPVADAAPSEESISEEIPVPEADPFAAPQEAGGFFSGDDDDETIALSGDELNNILNSADFTQEDGSNFGMEAPDGSVMPEGDGFAVEEPAAEAPAEEAPADDFSMDIPSEEAPAEEAAFDMPAPEAPADDFSMDIPSEEAPAEEAAFDMPAPEAPAEDDLDINFDEPVAEAPAEEAPADDFAMEAPADDFAVEEPASEAPADDFNTDLPSLKDESEPAAEETPAEDNFSLDEFDIPEPSVEESSIADIDIDEPDTEPKAEEEFSLDEFDIPEPSVEESSIADIDIDEPSSEIPAEEPASEETPAEDADFYANSDSPAIADDEMTAIDIQDNLEEPVLDDIDFGMDEPQAEDIEVPTGESLVVDSSSTDFLEEDDPTLDEQLTSEKVDYLNEEAAVDDLGAIPETEEAPAVEGMEDSLEADTIATSEDETPADDVFSSQWDETPAAPSFDANPEEEFVQAAKSFDDPIGFDIEEVPTEAPVAEAPAEDDFVTEEQAAEAPADDFAIEEPAADVPADEPVAAAAPAEALSGDIKQEVKSVLKYMDQLLENLPEDKIAEFAQSEHFETYKKLFNELGLV